MFVEDPPLVMVLAVTSGPTQPTVSLLAILHRPSYPVETMTECHLIAYGDA